MSFSKNLEKLVKDGGKFLRMLGNCNISYSRDLIWKKELPTSFELSKLSESLNVPADALLEGKISSTLNKDEFNIDLKKGFQYFKVVKGEREVHIEDGISKLTNRIVITIA